nr:uncharacterized protein LOC112026482 [Quercus suber]
MDKEFQALRYQHTWTSAPPPSNKNDVGSKWVFKIKRNSDDIITRPNVLQIFFINITSFTLSLPKLPLLLPVYLPLSIPLVDPHSNKSLAGALQYLTFTHPDLLFVVNQVCQFMTNPTVVHLQAAKRILRYLKVTLTSSILLKPGPIFLSTFSDADWAGDLSAR